MYKAIKKIGGYKIGEEVPEKDALVWLGMYSEPHVELVGTSVDSKEVVGESIEEKTTDAEKLVSNNPMLYDYLARGKGVVVKNISEDNLSKEQLGKLLILEKSDKKRSVVINAIDKKLKA